MCDTSNALVRSLVIWDHTVLPATLQRWFSRLCPGVLPYLFINPERMKGWVDLGGWLYHRRSPIQVLTGPDVD